MIKHLNVYIIDDDKDDQELLMEALKEIESSVIFYTASNGKEGLEKLDSEEMPIPDIIFLDLNIPKIKGRQFLFEIKSDPSFMKIPVIIYSTSSYKKDIDEVMLLGAADYLVKQTDFLHLKDKLNLILSIHLKEKSKFDG